MVRKKQTIDNIHLSRQQFRIEAMEQPQIKTLDEFNPIENSIDVSIAALPSRVSFWLSEVKNYRPKEFL